MNVIELRVVPHASGEFEVVEIVVDGRPLIDRVREHERPFAEREGHPDLAGAYMSIAAPSVCPPSRRLLGEPDKGRDWNSPKVALLGCTCGVTSCWPLLSTISVTPTTVTWSDFEQPHRRAGSAAVFWDYSGFGPFVFDRAQYEAALMAISAGKRQ
jgi:hypothetical protein